MATTQPTNPQIDHPKKRKIYPNKKLILSKALNERVRRSTFVFPIFTNFFRIYNGPVQLCTNQLVSFEDTLLSFNNKSLTDRLQSQEFDRQQKNLKLQNHKLQWGRDQICICHSCVYVYNIHNQALKCPRERTNHLAHKLLRQCPKSL